MKAPAILNKTPKWAIKASCCRTSFKYFVEQFWEEVPGAGKLLWNWHMDVLCEEMQTVAERVFANQPKEYDLVINISPGTSKSSVCSILFHPWTWTRMPGARHINSSHTDNLVLDLATKARFIIESDKYKRYFPEIELRSDQRAKGDFANTCGGERKSCTVGGKTPTGRHAHFLIGDDLIDPKKAISEAEQKTASDFVTQVLPSRKVRTAVDLAVTITIMQRLGMNDPTDVLLKTAKKEGATKIRHICLPAELSDRVEPIELKANYVDGLMDPVRLPRHVLEDFRVRLGEYGYAGQFMQSPIPQKGGMFKPQWFNQRVKAAPYHAEKRYRFWDRAATADAGCYSAGVLMSFSQGNYYIEHVEKGQWEPDERNERMRSTALRDRARYGPKQDPIIFVEREGGSSGRDAWKAVARALAGFRVYEVQVTGKKDSRAEPWAAQCAALNVYLVEDDTWDLQSYVDEHCLFRPEIGKRLGRYKDQVDASSGNFNKMVEGIQSTGIMQVRPTISRIGSKPGLRIVPCSKDQLKNLLIDERVVYISIADPGDNDKPDHGFNKLLEAVYLNYADIDPADHQEQWGEAIQPYGVTADKLIMQRDDGKRMWRAITVKRDPPLEVIVIQDQGDRRALSMAYAIADICRIPRKKCIWIPESSDNNSSVNLDGKAPNEHVYNVVKASREMVI